MVFGALADAFPLVLQQVFGALADAFPLVLQQGPQPLEASERFTVALEKASARLMKICLWTFPHVFVKEITALEIE
ncbi:hypothetical protein [Thauera sp. Sel9]|uniref:hypothetical protein n=1 Tax=Thauera sp. Sel9 TaxID=2974299 RepID=UPI0021E19284|nr:hypothetical protein [Thauera sp. Sel9]MCV2217393.1 hypothetical protein [Thauera sp. Sel9]